ncbi:MAG: hypothetical protein HRF50_17860 [Phycisphaerae bacterium]|jgi:hypothetical protein
MSSSSLGQTVSSRAFAASQPTELDPEADSARQPLWETAIATTSRRAIALYQNECIIDESEQKRIGFAVYDRQDSEWIGSGLISGGLVPATTDPSIAVDSVSGDFVACAYGGDASSVFHILTARYVAGLGWSSWMSRAQGPSSELIDKPWIVAGQMGGSAGDFTNVREFYITYWESTQSAYKYLRSVNSGSSWVGGTIEVDSQAVHGQPIAIQPTVAGSGPLYAAFRVKTNLGGRARFQFLKGTDINTGNDAGKVTFDYLDDESEAALTMLLNHNGQPSSIDQYFPGNLQIRTIVWLLADPTDEDRMFVVYDNTAGGVVSAGIPNDPNETTLPATGDFNVYARLLTYNSGEGYWELGDEVQVNDDDTLYESDQFLPSPTVDSSGRLHITWYDDRLYNASSDQLDGTGTADPKYDVFYAMGTVGANGLEFRDNELLYGTGDEEDEPALNYVRLHDPDPDWDFPDRPGEYNGIAADGDWVITSFTGTSAEDANQSGHNPSVIWSSTIDWSE